ncbi:MAG: aminotransferase, partial [Lancefieldella rimae]|nr:aminotransferase [Lancefieldella rimae]
METFPLYSRSFEEAKELQFKIVDCATKVFNGNDALSIGDLGVHKGTNEPLQTIRVEKVLARAFDAEDAVLVRGAGTGALRWALAATIKPGSTILVH